jgi:hypothetical protein
MAYLSRFVVTAALIAAVCLAGVSKADAKVKVYLDETRTDYVMAEELDCNTYEGKSGVSIGFIAKLIFFSVGPSVTLGKEENIQWDKSVHGILARYKELCNRFNAGAITMKEYKERLEQIDGISREMMELQRRMVKEVKEESKDAFRELDMETGGGHRAGQPDVRGTLDDIDQKLRDLPPAAPGNQLDGQGVE